MFQGDDIREKGSHAYLRMGVHDPLDDMELDERRSVITRRDQRDLRQSKGRGKGRGRGRGRGKEPVEDALPESEPQNMDVCDEVLQPEGHQVPQAEQEQPPEQDAMPVPPKRKSRAKAKAKASAEPSGESAVPKAKAKAKAKAKSGTRGKKRQVDNGDNGDSQIEPKPKRKQRRPIHDAPNPVPLEKRDEMKQFPVIVYITIFFWFGCVLNNFSNKLRLHML
jgi:hypothetical protein